MANTKVTNPVTGFNSATEEGLKLPSGTNANQPSGVQGMIRNDTGENTGGSTSAIEHHNGTNWQYFAATESPDVVYPTSLKMYLDASNTNSYPGTGTTWFDLTTNGNNGAITGASWNSTGYFVFAGSNDWIEIEDSTDTYFAFSDLIFTQEYWVNIDDVAAAENGLASKRDLGNPGNRSWITSIINSGIIRFIYYDAFSVSQSIVTASNVVSSSTWHQIVITGDGTNCKIYVDGVKKQTTAFSLNSIKESGADLQIARRGANSSWKYYNGDISRVRMYDTTLTENQVYTLFLEGKGF